MGAGYFGVLGVMVTLGLGLVGVFWRLGWLGTGSGAGEGGRRKPDPADVPVRRVRALLV